MAGRRTVERPTPVRPHALAGGGAEGPGEHQWLTFLGRLPGDSVVTCDIALGRASVPMAGLPTARGRISMARQRPWRVAILPDLFRLPRRPSWPGVRIATWSLDDGTVRELMSVPGDGNTSRVAAGDLANRIGKGPRWSVMPGRDNDTESFSVRSISLPDGATTAILRRDVPIGEVTNEHVEAFVEWMALRNVVYGGYSEEQAEASKPGWRKRPMSSTLPVLESILLDAAGNLWVEPHTVYGAAVPPPEVYAPDGTWLGTVALPSGRGGLLANGGLEIGDDYVLGVWRGGQGVEYVRMYALEKPE